MKERWLVTGGSGFVGRSIVRELQRRGEEVTVLARSPSSSPGEAPRIVADLSKPLQGLPHFDFVVHCAGHAHAVPRTEADAEVFRQVNAEGTRRLLEAIGRPKALVHISTVALYGRDEGFGLTEETPRKPTTPYGISKKVAEDLVVDWAAEKDVKLGVLRLPLVVGKGAPGNLHAMAKAISGGYFVRVGSGAARRSMVHVEDIAAVVPRLAEVGGIYHLTDGSDPSFAEIEATIARALHVRDPLRMPGWFMQLSARIGDLGQSMIGRNLPFNSLVLSKMTSTLTFSSKKARTELGFRPREVLDTLGEMIGA